MRSDSGREEVMFTDELVNGRRLRQDGLPNSLPFDIRTKALTLIKTARGNGWQIGLVHLTGNSNNPTIEFMGRSKAGAQFYISCEQAEFIERLTALFSKNGTPVDPVVFYEFRR